MTVQIISQKWDPKLQVDVANYAGLSTDVKPTILTPGSTFHESDTGDDYLSGPLGWTAKPAAAAQSVALSDAQNQIWKSASHSFPFEATGTVLTSAITYNGLIKHLLLIVPNFTNVVTATVTLEDAAGRVLWTSAAKARNAYHNLELDTSPVWIDQGVYSGLVWKVTISGVAGGSGGDVVLVPRYYGV